MTNSVYNIKKTSDVINDDANLNYVNVREMQNYQFSRLLLIFTLIIQFRTHFGLFSKMFVSKQKS